MQTNINSAHAIGNDMVLLAITLIKAKNYFGNEEYLQVLIDSSSQTAFITEELANLAFPRQKI